MGSLNSNKTSLKKKKKVHLCRETDERRRKKHWTHTGRYRSQIHLLFLPPLMSTRSSSFCVSEIKFSFSGSLYNKSNGSYTAGTIKTSLVLTSPSSSFPFKSNPHAGLSAAKTTTSRQKASSSVNSSQKPAAQRNQA